VTHDPAAFREIFYAFGEPEWLHTDNGAEFRNDNLRSFLDTLGVKRIFGRPRHPQSQGQVERVNQTLKGILSSFNIARNLNNRWVDILSEACSIINRTVHEATGKIPMRVFFGRKIGNPVVGLTTADLEPNSSSASTGLTDEIDDIELLEMPSKENTVGDDENLIILPEDDPVRVQTEITEHRLKYEKKLSSPWTWKTVCGKDYVKGATVLLYKDFDANVKTKKMPFDKESLAEGPLTDSQKGPGKIFNFLRKRKES